ncbi:CopG family antitoxin [Gluconacetobacter sacchari]
MCAARGSTSIAVTCMYSSMPSLRSDREAEDFVATADLTQYDLSGFKPMRFEIEPKPDVAQPW